MYLKKRITMNMKEDGILIQPNATYVPKLSFLLKVSGRRRKGLPYHAILESFSADLQWMPRIWLVNKQLCSGLAWV